MAKREVVTIVDDLTGKQLAEGAAERVRFSLDGVSYELDTSVREAQRLKKALAQFVNSGRRTASPRSSSRSAPKGRNETVVSPVAVRAWAAANGIEVNARGRIARSVVEQFEAAGN